MPIVKALLRQDYRGEHPFQTYCRFYAGHGWRIAFCVVMFLIKYSPVILVPIFTANIVNAVAVYIADPGTDQTMTILWNGGLAALFIVQNIFTHVVFVRQESIIIRNVEMKLRSNLCVRLQQLSMHYLAEKKIGVLQAKVIRDVENIEQLTRCFVDSLPGIIATITTAIIVTAFRAPLFIFFYLATVPLAVVIYRTLRRRIADNNSNFRRSVEDMSGQVTEMLRLIPITRAHHAEDAELGRINRRLHDIQTSGLRLDYINAIFGSVNWVVFMIFNIITLVTAGFLRIYHVLDIEVGDIVLLSGYFNSISGSVMGILGTIPLVTKGLESVRSVSEVLECPDIEHNAGKPLLETVRGGFSFEHVEFTYPGNGIPALADFDLHIAPGETIALVGPSGAGKSTIAQLIIGFIRPTQGRILLDGCDMNDLDLRSYRKFISVVTQESLLFDGTIRDNVRYGLESRATEKMIRQAVHDADLDEFIGTLPDGLDTMIHEGGSRLSGGQKQRLAIARALLRDPRVLVLDEATSALDVEAEAEIQKALNNLVRGRTTFIIAHRLSTVRNADRIVVLKNGRIAEIGKHEELLKRNGVYAEMYRKFIASSDL